MLLRPIHHHNPPDNFVYIEGSFSQQFLLKIQHFPIINNTMFKFELSIFTAALYPGLYVYLSYLKLLDQFWFPDRYLQQTFLQQIFSTDIFKAAIHPDLYICHSHFRLLTQFQFPDRYPQHPHSRPSSWFVRLSQPFQTPGSVVTCWALTGRLVWGFQNRMCCCVLR